MSKISARRKKILLRNKALADEYGIKMRYWRYDGRKGIFWSLFSQYIRKRDLLRFGTCVSCGKTFFDIREVQAGHYAPAGNCGFKLLFDERNVNAECPTCNNPMFSSGKLIPYRTNLVNRYGEKWVKKLDAEYKNQTITKEWGQAEYDNKIKELIAKNKELDEEISKKLGRG